MLINKKKQFYVENNLIDKFFKLDWFLLLIVLLICTIGFGLYILLLMVKCIHGQLIIFIRAF